MKSITFKNNLKIEFGEHENSYYHKDIPISRNQARVLYGQNFENMDLLNNSDMFHRAFDELDELNSNLPLYLDLLTIKLTNDDGTIDAVVPEIKSIEHDKTLKLCLDYSKSDRYEMHDYTKSALFNANIDELQVFGMNNVNQEKIESFKDVISNLNMYNVIDLDTDFNNAEYLRGVESKYNNIKTFGMENITLNKKELYSILNENVLKFKNGLEIAYDKKTEILEWRYKGNELHPIQAKEWLKESCGILDYHNEKEFNDQFKRIEDFVKNSNSLNIGSIIYRDSFKDIIGNDKYFGVIPEITEFPKKFDTIKFDYKEADIYKLSRITLEKIKEMDIKNIQIDGFKYGRFEFNENNINRIINNIDLAKIEHIKVDGDFLLCEDVLNKCKNIVTYEMNGKTFSKEELMDRIYEEKETYMKYTVKMELEKPFSENVKATILPCSGLYQIEYMGLPIGTCDSKFDNINFDEGIMEDIKFNQMYIPIGLDHDKEISFRDKDQFEK